MKSDPGRVMAGKAASSTPTPRAGEREGPGFGDRTYSFRAVSFAGFRAEPCDLLVAALPLGCTGNMPPPHLIGSPIFVVAFCFLVFGTHKHIH